MEEIREHLSSFIKKMNPVDDADINELVLGDYLDSLELVDLVLEVEETYHIEIDERDVNKWPDMHLMDVVQYIKNKID